MAQPPASDPEVLARWRESLEDDSEKQRLAQMLLRILMFANTPQALREAIVDELWPLQLRAGTSLWGPQDTGSWMGIVLSGRLEMLMQQGLQGMAGSVKIGDVAPGGIVGDVGLLRVSNVRGSAVIVAEDCVLLVLTQERFEAVVADYGGDESFPVLPDARKMQNLMADRESFCDLRCFKNLDDDFVSALIDYLEPRLVYPGTNIMKEGNYGNEMYILQTGDVKVERDGKLIAECSSGTVLGELAVLGLDKRRTATVTATKLCLVYVLHGDVFHEEVKKFPNSKSVFDRAYVGRLLRHQLEKSRDEKARMDTFFGKAHPLERTNFERMMEGEGNDWDDTKLAIADAKAAGRTMLPAPPPSA